MGRGEIRVSDNEDVRKEKVKGREKKWESLSWERETERERERDCFPFFFFFFFFLKKII